MAFDKFKANHGGLGPLQALNSAVSGGEGVAGRMGAKRARSLLTSVIEDQQGDSELSESMAPVWDRLKRTRMTEDDLSRSANLLVERASEVKNTHSAYADFTELQSRYRAKANSDEDRGILDTLDTQAKIARDKLLSNNPKIQEQGRDLSAQLLTAQREYATKNEEQAIAAKNLVGEQTWSRFGAIRDDYARDTASFKQRNSAWQIMQAAAFQPDRAGDIGRINAFMHIIEPTSIVMPGEAATVAGAQGVPALLVTAIARVANDGGVFTEADRKQLDKFARSIMETSNVSLTETNQRYTKMTRAGDIPDELGSTMFVNPADVSHLPGEQFGASSAAAGPPKPVPPGKADVNPYVPDAPARAAGEAVRDSVGNLVGGTVQFLNGAVPWPSGRRGAPPVAPPRQHASGIIRRNTDEFPQ